LIVVFFFFVVVPWWLHQKLHQKVSAILSASPFLVELPEAFVWPQVYVRVLDTCHQAINFSENLWR